MAFDRAQLTGGDRRSIGRSNALASELVHDHALLPMVWSALLDQDPLVRMRAADALEKATRSCPELLDGRESLAIELLQTSGQQEMRWHLLQMVPRLSLTDEQRAMLFGLARQLLGDRSRIVSAEALGALFALARTDLNLLAQAKAIAQAIPANAPPSLRARARRLLAH